jgi:hypothetical protein
VQHFGPPFVLGPEPHPDHFRGHVVERRKPHSLHFAVIDNLKLLVDSAAYDSLWL